MSLDILKLDAGVEVEADTDTLGGGGVQSTDVYALTCEYMYLDQTQSGALMAMGSFKTEAGVSIRFSECIMSKKSGTLKATYTDKRSNKEVPLPGYSKVLHLAQAMGLDVQDLSGLTAEKKILKLYDFEQKKELPQEKNVITDFTGKRIQAAIYEVVETKMAKDGEGNYTVPTSEERKLNTFDKWFTAEGRTIEEVNAEKQIAELTAAGQTVPPKLQAIADGSFREVWLEAHFGKVRDKRKKDAPKAGAPGKPAGGAKLSFD